MALDFDSTLSRTLVRNSKSFKPLRQIFSSLNESSGTNTLRLVFSSLSTTSKSTKIVNRFTAKRDSYVVTNEIIKRTELLKRKIQDKKKFKIKI